MILLIILLIMCIIPFIALGIFTTFYDPLLCVLGIHDLMVLKNNEFDKEIWHALNDNRGFRLVYASRPCRCVRCKKIKVKEILYITKKDIGFEPVGMRDFVNNHHYSNFIRIENII